MTESSFKGLIQIYTGDGKGKTTAALGQALRASGRDLKVVVIQFMKGTPSGELLSVSKYPAFEIIQTSIGNSFDKPTEQLREEAQHTMALAGEKMLSGDCDLIVLDEIFTAINRGLISTEQVVNLLSKKPEQVELVLTGRKAPTEIVKRADLVTEMLMIKHPYTQGIAARQGIEY